MFQNTCVRFILNLRKFDHISGGIKSLGLLKMEQVRYLHTLTFMHKIILGNAPSYLCEKIKFQGEHHSHKTRYRANIRYYHFKTNFGRNCFFNYASKEYNHITNILKITPYNCSIASFKFHLKKYLLGI